MPWMPGLSNGVSAGHSSILRRTGRTSWLHGPLPQLWSRRALQADPDATGNTAQNSTVTDKDTT